MVADDALPDPRFATLDGGASTPRSASTTLRARPPASRSFVRPRSAPDAPGAWGPPRHRRRPPPAWRGGVENDPASRPRRRERSTRRARSSRGPRSSAPPRGAPGRSHTRAGRRAHRRASSTSGSPSGASDDDPRPRPRSRHRTLGAGPSRSPSASATHARRVGHGPTSRSPRLAASGRYSTRPSAHARALRFLKRAPPAPRTSRAGRHSRATPHRASTTAPATPDATTPSGAPRARHGRRRPLCLATPRRHARELRPQPPAGIRGASLTVAARTPPSRAGGLVARRTASTSPASTCCSAGSSRPARVATTRPPPSSPDRRIDVATAHDDSDGARWGSAGGPRRRRPRPRRPRTRRPPRRSLFRRRRAGRRRDVAWPRPRRRSPGRLAYPRASGPAMRSSLRLRDGRTLLLDADALVDLARRGPLRVLVALFRGEGSGSPARPSITRAVCSRQGGQGERDVPRVGGGAESYVAVRRLRVLGPRRGAHHHSTAAAPSTCARRRVVSRVRIVRPRRATRGRLALPDRACVRPLPPSSLAAALPVGLSSAASVARPSPTPAGAPDRRSLARP